MQLKNTLGRAAGMVALVVICWLSLAGVASAHAAKPLLTGSVSGCAIQTINGHTLTAVDGGGRTTNAIRTNETHVQAWEKFALISLGANNQYAIQTINGNYVTAV